MTDLPHALERAVLIRATLPTVFRYFTDSERFAAWWGPGSSIDPRPGGPVRICYPNGVIASGEVLEIDDGRRIAFTYGYESPDKPIPPGGSRVIVTLREDAGGTLVQLRHELDDAAARDAHVPGWRYQLAVFANVAAREQHGDATDIVERWLRLWAEPDDGARRRALLEATGEEVTFRDAFGCTRGRDDLAAHITAVAMHMPGVTITRRGAVRHCQGTALFDWVASDPQGAERGRGSTVLELLPDGRIGAATGLWAEPAG